MKQRKLNYIFHNPNAVEATADVLLRVLMETNARKVENAIKEDIARTEQKKAN